MKLYLMRHGSAFPSHFDPRRPLSEEGRAEVEAVSGFLSRAAIRPARIIHSGITRAQETAEIVAPRVGSPLLEVSPHLAPECDPSDAAGLVSGKSDLMFVGHLPLLPKLASWLLLQGEERSFLHVPPATVVCLERDPEMMWDLLWMVGPDLAMSGDVPG